jgi:glycogen debranching enzyme
MGTVSGNNSRRYHGHLIAATEPPTGRTLVWANLEAEVRVGLATEPISTNQYHAVIHPKGYQHLTSFQVDQSARWTYSVLGVQLEKELVLVPNEQTAWVRIRHLGGHTADLILRPLVAWRDHHGDFFCGNGFPTRIDFNPDETLVTWLDSNLTLLHPSAVCTPVQGWYYRFEHDRERERGLNSRDDLYCPMELRQRLRPGDEMVIGCTLAETPTQPSWPVEREEVSVRLSPILVDAVKHFRVSSGRRETLLAGYPWFSDWGRDTMISIPGVCLVTGHVEMARGILSGYADLLNEGMIPNRIVSEGEQPDYNTVDATLWFANAVYKTLIADWNEAFALAMFSKLHQIYWHHTKGTRFGIRVDPADGLLRQGEEGANLTWMDAKVGDWVVTPRYGKPIEIAALWINLLRILEWLANRIEDRDPSPYRAAAERAESTFEDKFWHPVRGHYLDTADPSDASLRPNQVLAMALPFSPCESSNAAKALQVVRRELLTPIGLRTLGRNEPAYQGRFEGDMTARDAAYHQGTAWPWLLGSYATAIVKHTQDIETARKSLRNAVAMAMEYGIGGIAEVYDGDPPHRPGGCPWQSWSAAEILRAWVEDCGGD